MEDKMKNLVKALAITTTLAIGSLALQAQADTINYVGISTPVATFDWLPGNTLAVSSVPLSTDPNSQTSFTSYTQGSLGSFVDAGNNVITGTGLHSAYEITFVGGFGETGFRTVFGTSQTATFFFDSTSPTNFLQIYSDTSLNSDPLAGTGFNDGTLILSGHLTDITGAAFTSNSATLAPLDEFGTDNYPGTLSIKGGGGANLAVAVDYVNPSYITTALNRILIQDPFNSSLVVPFNQVDPSAQFWDGSSLIAHNVGSVNGFTGPDFQFQSDPTSSFITAAVPEPSTMLLTCLGLLALGGAGLRRRFQK